jgi:CRISPR-associated protein Cas8a1/Csx13
MIVKLEQAEEALVRSVHTAIRQRFNRIAEESPSSAARKNRWDGERERWRLAFWGAKTPDQIRAALESSTGGAPAAGALCDEVILRGRNCQG